MHTANPSRDAAVHLEWLREQLPTLTSSEYVGVQWFIEYLDHERGAADAKLLQRVDSLFAITRRRTIRALRAAPAKRMKRKPTSLAQVAADYIIGQANALKERLAAVHTAADHHEAHAARIDGKKLRYLLEPFAPYLPDIDPILGQLKRLQDTAGDLHDVQVFTDEVIVAAQRAAATHTKRLALAIFKGDLHAVAQTQQENPIPGILTLAARLRERGTRCFETLKREWLDGAAEDLLNQVHAAAHALRAASTSQCPPLYGDRS